MKDRTSARRITFLMGRYPEEERARRRRAIEAGASEGTQIEYRELPGSFYDGRSGVLTAAFIVPEVCKAAVAAEQAGAQAVITLGTLDPGVDQARHLVDIPVLGAGRPGYHMAANVGNRIGVIVYKDENIPFSRRLAEQHRMQDFVVGYRGVNIGLSGLTDGREEMRKRFGEAARRLVEERDADVILPQGISMVPVHFSAQEMAAEIGIPVIDALAASIRTAEYLIDTGVTNSRGAYAKFDLSEVIP